MPALGMTEQDIEAFAALQWRPLPAHRPLA